MQPIGAPMVALERIKRSEGSLDFGNVHPPQTREERLFFISSVFRRGFEKITQRRLHRRARVRIEWLFEQRRNSHERTEKHLDATMTVRQESGRLRKAVSLTSNLDRHLEFRILQPENATCWVHSAATLGCYN